MANPAGNYPGRQIFLGSTLDGHPSFVYVVTGRSDKSKGRVASPYLLDQNAIRMRPIDSDEKFDAFRHYEAVRIDRETGILVVSNSQAPVDGTLEFYKFGSNIAERGFAQEMLALLGPEYDSQTKRTSRILGISMPFEESWLNVLAITTRDGEATGNRDYFTGLHLSPGIFRHLPTYNGDVEYSNFHPEYLMRNLTLVELGQRSPEDLAEALYDMTDYEDPTYGDLRVCTIAGVRNGRGFGGWELATKNRWNSLEQFKSYLAGREGEK